MHTFIAVICIIAFMVMMDDLLGFDYFKSEQELEDDRKDEELSSMIIKCDYCCKGIDTENMHYDEMNQEVFCNEDCAFEQSEKHAMKDEPYGETIPITRHDVIYLASESLLKQQGKAE